MSNAKNCLRTFCLLIAMCLACGDNETQTEIFQYDIYPSCIITCSEFDSSYAFSAISDVGHFSNGCIGVLDRLTASLHVFSEDGEFLFTIGRKGEGPGEFTSPDCFMSLEDGKLVIFDKRARRVTMYQENGEYIGEMVNTDNISIPYRCMSNGANRIVGGLLEIERRDSGAYLLYSLCVLNSDMLPIDTLLSRETRIENEDMSHILYNSLYSCAYTADEIGNVFIVPIEHDRINLVGFAEDGQEILNITESIEPIRKSDEEMRLEKERFIRMFSFRNNIENVQYTPSEFRYNIPPQGLHSDNRGYIWMLSGQNLSPVFHVYNYAGELMYIVNLCGMGEEDTTDVLWWKFTSYGILAFSVDPYYDPEVYFFQYPF